MVTVAVGDEGFEDERADRRLWQLCGNRPKSGGFPVTMDNVRYHDPDLLLRDAVGAL
jgi:hypothetical protein